MGWITNRKMRTGCSLYDGGPKRKGPLKKIVVLTSFSNDFFDCHTGWLECGHWSNRIYGEKRAICEKCRQGKPKDKKGRDGWPK